MEDTQHTQQLKREDSISNSLISDDDDGDDDDDDDDEYKEGKSTSSKSITSGTGYSMSSTEGADAARQEIRDIMRKETKAVLMWREIVTGMLVITACFVTVTTYIFLSRQEVDDFTAGFNAVSDAVISSMNYRMKILHESFEGFSDVTTSFGIEKWPFVNVPNFDTHAEHVRDVTRVSALWWNPIVRGQEQEAWNEYVKYNVENEVVPAIYEIENQTVHPVTGLGPYSPIWQIDPPSLVFPSNHSLVNFNVLSDPIYRQAASTINVLKHSIVSDLTQQSLLRGVPVNQRVDEPCSMITTPVFDSIGSTYIVGYMTGIFSWTNLFSNVLSIEQGPVYAVVNTTCSETNSSFTFYIVGPEASFAGEGNNIDAPEHYRLQVSTNLTIFLDPEQASQAGACHYTLDVYPSAALRDSYRTNAPELYTALVGLVFIAVVVTFFSYDIFVQRRNEKVVATAARTTALVSTLFPGNVRNRLLAADDKMKSGDVSSPWTAPSKGLNSYLQSGAEDYKAILDTKPLADLFPDATIMFCDLVGFTAWSSVREPSQVFTLLETLFRGFDQAARRRRVFKVETVGDCYVAVAGVPDPRPDHAVAMAKFAHDCIHSAKDLTKQLEVRLGPDTADLTCRVGLHSGPVTAGVLRGDRSRFQLFGDTMNTAARLESTGASSRVHVSQETAVLLIAAGKEHWLIPREDTVYAKGKGQMKTYWLHLKNYGDGVKSNRSSSAQSSQNPFDHVDEDDLGDDVKRLLSEKQKRLVSWNCDVLLRLLKQIIARRQATTAETRNAKWSVPEEEIVGHPKHIVHPRSTVLDEVKEIISLPEFDPELARHQKDPESIQLPENVVNQLFDYISRVSIMYRENPFHNFEHASHVTMSVTKLLSRIVAPSDVLNNMDNSASDVNRLASSLHDHTYGITSDPLTQFACVFSALIHDVDHQGVPNTQLVKENMIVAAMYNNKSVAEQNSIDLAWNLFMDAEYKDLRATVCGTEEEFRRFRQLVVNSVLATDIMDKDLKALRNARWEKAFSEIRADESAMDSVNRKATIVIEHLIQASDVAHTMQHWHIYRKWNERFFTECYKAYREGRAETDPSLNWYKGEIGFFDFYIIPLAKKLKDCGVFGVSSDEYLNYAVKNREEWEVRGNDVVAEMLQRVRYEFGEVDDLKNRVDL